MICMGQQIYSAWLKGREYEEKREKDKDGEMYKVQTCAVNMAAISNIWLLICKLFKIKMN